MPTIAANGSRIYYESLGDGEPLLLVAGFACDHTYWSLAVPALSRRFRVIAIDIRGTGQSTNADDTLSAELLAADAAALLKALGIESAHVAGHSLGGMIAQELALAHPERVRSLTLISSCAQVDNRGRAIIELWGELPRLTDPRTMARLIAPWMYTNRLFALPGAVEKLIDDMLAAPHPPTLEGILHQSRAISRFDAVNRLSQIAAPTHVMVGRDDILLPVGLSEQLARGIPGATLTVIDDVGHGLLIEAPDRTAAAMIEFLDSPVRR